MVSINTDKFSAELRIKAIDLSKRSILVTNYEGSEQEKDLTEPSNCAGFGRIRHFKLNPGGDWPQNPLPILPAAKALNIDPEHEIRAQVFQNSICNWRCWYCFVDFKLLKGDTKYSSFLNCEELLDLYLAEDSPPKVIDLTGGQPDLTPEWIPWMMEALMERGLQDSVFLWSDDNLSTDYLWKYLDDKQIDLISSYKMYARVCCFKGIDPESFSLNTKANPSLFPRQFDLCKRLLDLGIDLYCYITLTAPSNCDFSYLIPKFFDSIQKINEKLPLRIVPLQIFDFTPVKSRMKKDADLEGIKSGQYGAIRIWMEEIEKRFTQLDCQLAITEVNLK